MQTMKRDLETDVSAVQVVDGGSCPESAAAPARDLEKKPRILFVGSFPEAGSTIVGGNVTDCAVLLEAGLAEQFDLATVDSTQRTMPIPPLWLRFLYGFPRAFHFARQLWRHSPEAIILFCSNGLSLVEKSLLALAGRLVGCRVLLSPRGGRLMDDCRNNRLYRRFARSLLRIPNVLLCQGEVWRDFFVDELNLPAERCCVLKSWTATPAMLQIGETRSYDEELDCRILFLASLCRDKGVFELIDAFSQLAETFPQARLCIAGDGADSEAAKAEVTRRGLQDRVEFLGWVGGDRKLDALANATIFCLPSYVEGLPNAMIEAMATGLPVVITPVGSIPDVIEHGVSGLICPTKNANELAKHLGQLLADGNLRQEFGRRGHEIAARDYTVSQAIESLLVLVSDQRGVLP